MFAQSIVLLLFSFALLKEANALESKSKIDEKLESKNSNNQFTLPIQYVGTDESYFFDFAYTVPISIGTPRQNFDVYLDQRLGDTFVAHTSCESLTKGCIKFCRRGCSKFGCDGCCSADYYACNVKDKFDNTTSSTFKKIDGTWNPPEEYEGFFGKEKVSFGADQDLIEIQNTNVEFATYITENVLDGNYSDGIFGLGFSNDKTPVWKTAFNQNLFDKQVFTIMLEKGDPKQGEHAGTLEFGSTDGCKSESIKFFNVTNYHDSWEFAFNSTLFNGEPLSYSRPHNAVVDINQKLILVPSLELNAIVRQTNATYNFEYYVYTVDCNTKFTWGFQLGDIVIEIKSEGLLKPNKLLGGCILPFNTEYDRDPDYILGVPVLKQWCTVYDYKNLGVGFGQPNYKN